MKFRAALGFFTRLPVGSAPLPPTFQGVIVWLPAIGLIVGLLAALAVALATLLLPAQLGTVVDRAISSDAYRHYFIRNHIKFPFSVCCQSPARHPIVVL